MADKNKIGIDLLSDVNTNSYLTDWLGSRKEVLRKNMMETSLKNYVNSNPHEVDRRIQSYKKRIGATPEVINPNLPSGVNGVTKTIGNKSSIEYPGIPLPQTRTHEQTHASGVIPDVSNTIKRITGLDYSPGNKLTDVQMPEELYPRLMEIRQANELSPDVQYSPEDVAKFRKNNSGQKNNALFDYFDDNTISKLLNEVAINDAKNEIKLNGRSS